MPTPMPTAADPALPELESCAPETDDLETHPDRYRRWALYTGGAVARLVLAAPAAGADDDGLDLAAELELRDALTRLRFEHPEVRALVVEQAPRAAADGSDTDGAPAAPAAPLTPGAIAARLGLLGLANETRCALEDASTNSGLRSLAAVGGACAGAAYELALACDELHLIDAADATLSLPGVTRRGLLPATGGLTRLVDKRLVRRDRADRFATLAGGLGGTQAVEWRLADALHPPASFASAVSARAAALAAAVPEKAGPGVPLSPVAPRVEGTTRRYRHVTLAVEGPVARLTVAGPAAGAPLSAEILRLVGADLWHLRAFRELDHALCHLALREPGVTLVTLHTTGAPGLVTEHDAALSALAKQDWFAREVLLLVYRTLKGLDLCPQSLYAVAGRGSCFAGSLLELALAADRTYLLADEAETVGVTLSPLNRGALPMASGLSRLQTRFLHAPDQARALFALQGHLRGLSAEKVGLATAALAEGDFEAEVERAVRERLAQSPDATAGLTANLRFAGPETMETKIFGRLSAWQRWVRDRQGSPRRFS